MPAGAPRWTEDPNRRRTPREVYPVAERPHDQDVDFAARNGWDQPFEAFSDFDLPTYVGLPTFMKLPWVTNPVELRARNVDVAIVGDDDEHADWLAGQPAQ